MAGVDEVHPSESVAIPQSSSKILPHPELHHIRHRIRVILRPRTLLWDLLIGRGLMGTDDVVLPHRRRHVVVLWRQDSSTNIEVEQCSICAGP